MKANTTTITVEIRVPKTRAEREAYRNFVDNCNEIGRLRMLVQADQQWDMELQKKLQEVTG